MINLRKSKTHKDWLIIILSTITCLCISFILYSSLGVNLLEKYLHVSPYGYMAYYFNRKNAPKNNPQPPKSNSNVIIFSPSGDNKDELSINNIAGTIESISSFNPRIIAVDILYEEGYEPEENDALKERIGSAINNCNCPVLFPSIIYRDADGSVVHNNSVFVETASCSAALPDFWSLSRFDSIDEKIERFPFAIARLSGYMRDELKNVEDYDKFIPDFGWKDFDVVSSLSGCERANIEDQIVLIGDINDFKDVKLIPFRIEGTDKIPGIIVNAYLVNSFITPSDTNNVIYKRNWAVNMSVCLILLFLVASLTHILGRSIAENKDRSPIISYCIVLIRSAFVIIYPFAAFWLCYMLTAHFHIVFNMTALLLPGMFVVAMDGFYSSLIIKDAK